jgi:hypothetical protein
MNLFCAAIHSNGYSEGGAVYIKLNDREQLAVRELECDLESFHYTRNQRVTSLLRNSGVKVFLDSGAFSAHTLGVELSVPEYCAYIKENEDLIRVEDGIKLVSVLDGIGDALLTWQNQQHMERLGVRPLPCFHAGEPSEYLEHYVANYDYITLGGMVGARPDQLQVWLDRIWDRHLVDGAGHPRVRVHGFGITSLQLMARYPWSSVDSSSWIQSASYGAIVTRYGAVQISTQSPFRHVRGQHMVNFTEPEQQVLMEEIVSLGFEVERLATRYEARAAFNIKSFNDLAPTIKTERFEATVHELF